MDNKKLVEAMAQETFNRLSMEINAKAGKEVATDEDSFIANLDLLATEEQEKDQVFRFLSLSKKWSVFRLMYPDGSYTADIDYRQIGGKDTCTAKVFLYRNRADMDAGRYSSFGIRAIPLENLLVFEDQATRIERWPKIALGSALSKALDMEQIAPWIPSREDIEAGEQTGDQAAETASVTTPTASTQEAAVSTPTQAEQKKDESKEDKKLKTKSDPAPASKLVDNEELPFTEDAPAVSKGLEYALNFPVMKKGKDGQPFETTLGKMGDEKPGSIVRLLQWSGCSEEMKSAIKTIIKADYNRYKEYYEKAGFIKEDL